QMPTQELAQLCHLSPGFLQGGQHGLDVSIEDFASLGELHLLAVTGKKRFAQFRFQGFDLDAERWLSQSHMGGGTGHTAFPRNDIKAAKMGEFHRFLICYVYAKHKNNKLTLYSIMSYAMQQRS